MSTKQDTTGMRPKIGQMKMTLPVTFNYSGGRKDSQKMAKVWAVVVCIVGTIMGLGVFFGKGGNFAVNILLGLGVLYITYFIARFFLLKEGNLRREEIHRRDNDLALDFKEIWGIYSVENSYPYICRFKNGRSGIYITLNKDVILGKYSESEYNHYEAIGDAINLCGASSLQVCHIDYMDNIGADERIDEAFANLGNIVPGLRDIQTDILTYQQKQMQERVTTFDTYLFSWKGSDISARNMIRRILNCFLQANYRNYHVLNASDLNNLTKIIFNLDNFSVNDAKLGVFNENLSVNSIVPIEIHHSDGTVTKLNKTREERAKELEEQKNQKQSKRKKEVN